MKITRLRIKNFKSINEAVVDFKSNMSGIYGPNGTGKTAIIEAIEIFNLYFDFNLSKDFIEKFKNKVNSLMKLGTKSMEIEVDIESTEKVYRIYLNFIKDKENNIFTRSEKVEWKENLPNKKFKILIESINELEDIIPRLFMEKSSNKTAINYVGFFAEKILKSKEIHLKSVLSDFNSFNSFISLIYDYSKDMDKNILDKKFNTFLIYWEEISKILKMIIVVTLEEQALYNVDLLLPIKVHNENMHGTFTLKYGNSNNIYSENVAIELNKIVEEINTIFSVIVPDAKLSVKKDLVRQTDGNREYAVEIFVMKEDKAIPIERESTGIIKIVSLLSALIYYIQDEKAIVVIDELDIHIFEYLLAIILDKISRYAKGQLIFTAHNLLPLEKLNWNSIIVSSKKDKEVVYTYLKGMSATTNLRNKYLRSQSLWSEENIQPLLINEPALDLFIKRLVR